MEAGMARAPYFNAVTQGIVWPLLVTIVAGLLMGVFSSCSRWCSDLQARSPSSRIRRSCSPWRRCSML
jgi:hypothetical protein